MKISLETNLRDVWRIRLLKVKLFRRRSREDEKLLDFIYILFIYLFIYLFIFAGEEHVNLKWVVTFR